MKLRFVFTVAVLAAALLATGHSTADENLKSGPQVGQTVPGPFHPLNVTGQWAGEKHCLYCEHGSNPVAMVFARSVSPGLTKLVKELDRATAQNKKKAMGSFVVFLDDNEGLADQLKQLAKKEGLKATALAIDNPAGPEMYQVSRKADVTVVLYEDGTVRVNRAFARGELNEQAVGEIVKELPKILP